MPYKQTTYETCLACCLLTSVGKMTKKNELACIIHSMKFNREDFIAGHLDFIKKKYGKTFTRYVHFAPYVRELKTLGFSAKHHKIGEAFIDKHIGAKPILLLDTHILHKYVHYPHYVILLGKHKKNYTLYDPWDGKNKTLSSHDLKKSLNSLSRRLWMSPQLLVRD